MLCARSFAAMSASLGGKQIAARHDGVARADRHREVVDAVHDLRRPGRRAGPRAEDARARPVLRRRSCDTRADRSCRAIGTRRRASSCSVPDSAPAVHVRDRLVVGRLDDGLHLLRVRVRVVEQRHDVGVLRVDAALERRLARRLGDDREPVAQAVVVDDELGFDGPGGAVVAPARGRPGVGRRQRVREDLEAEVAAAPCRARRGRACRACSRAGPAPRPAPSSCRRCWRSRARRGSSGGRRGAAPDPSR